MKNKLLVGILILCSTQIITAQTKKVIVAKDGSGDFRTVQQAIDAVKDSSKYVTTIFIRNGVYKEKLHLAVSKMNVHFIGENVEKTILTFDDYATRKDSAGKDIGTSGSASFFVFGSDFTAENISFENAAGPVGQAVAVRVTGDKATFINCRFLGCQDTLFTHGDNCRQYYYKCYIEGTVDFIFGGSTAVFEDCTVYGKRGGYFTAAATPEKSKFGYVFLNCKITGDAPTASYYLGRPWKPHAKTAFINCWIDKMVKPEGWHNWGKMDNEKTTFYAEYKNYGEGATLNGRVPWSRQLSEFDVKEYTIQNIFGDWKLMKTR